MFQIPAAVKYLSILGIVVAVLFSLWYVTGLREDLAISKENVNKLTSAVETQQSVIVQMQSEQAEIRKINSSMSSRIRAQDKDISDLRDRFERSANGEPRDFAALAAAKPELIERAINRGSKNAARCIEIATGSPLTEAEKNATTPDTINRECPALANPNYKPVSP